MNRIFITVVISLVSISSIQAEFLWFGKSSASKDRELNELKKQLKYSENLRIQNLNEYNKLMEENQKIKNKEAVTNVTTGESKKDARRLENSDVMEGVALPTLIESTSERIKSTIDNKFDLLYEQNKAIKDDLQTIGQRQTMLETKQDLIKKQDPLIARDIYLVAPKITAFQETNTIKYEIKLTFLHKLFNNYTITNIELIPIDFKDELMDDPYTPSGFKPFKCESPKGTENNYPISITLRKPHIVESFRVTITGHDSTNVPYVLTGDIKVETINEITAHALEIIGDIYHADQEEPYIASTYYYRAYTMSLESDRLMAKLARVLNQIGQFKMAVMYYDMALQINGNNTKYLNEQSIALSNLSVQNKKKAELLPETKEIKQSRIGYYNIKLPEQFEEERQHRRNKDKAIEEEVSYFSELTGVN